MEGVHILSKRVTLTFEADLGANTIFADKLLFIYYLTPQLSSIIFQPECNPLSTQTSKLLPIRDKVFKISAHTKHKVKIHKKRILPSSRNEAENPDPDYI